MYRWPDYCILRGVESVHMTITISQKILLYMWNVIGLGCFVNMHGSERMTERHYRAKYKWIKIYWRVCYLL